MSIFDKMKRGFVRVPSFKCLMPINDQAKNMVRIEEEVFFKALGFLAVIMGSEGAQRDGAVRAQALACMMKEFCSLENTFSKQGDKIQKGKNDHGKKA